MNGTSRRLLALLLGATLAADAGAAGILGDADGDGDVDGDDLIAVQTEFGSVGPTPLLGDGDCDGDVDSGDLFAVITNDPLFSVGTFAGSEVTFDFRDPDLDETFDVYFEATGSAGLAIYFFELTGLSDTSIDPSGVVWQQNTLGGVDTNLNPRGFLSSSAGNTSNADGFQAYGSQWNTAFPIYGIGEEEIEIEGFPDISLGAPALLGQLTIPGFYNLSDAEALAAIQPTAALFNSESSTTIVGLPESVEVLLTGPPLLGDPDQDGDIDGDDLIAVQESFGAVGPVPLFGDGDGDGDVDGDDLIVVQANFGIVVGVAVPEPSSGVVLSLLLAGVAARRPTRS